MLTITFVIITSLTFTFVITLLTIRFVIITFLRHYICYEDTLLTITYVITSLNTFMLIMINILYYFIENTSCCLFLVLIKNVVVVCVTAT